MSTKFTRVSLHGLDSDSVSMGFDHDGHASATLTDGTQLHWNTLADFEAFVDTLHAKVMAAAEVTA